MVLHTKSVIFNIAIYPDNIFPYFKCNMVSNLWQQLGFASEFDLQGTVDWGKKRFFNFIAEKTQLVSSDNLNNYDAVDVKIDESVLGKVFFLRCGDCIFFLT